MFLLAITISIAFLFNRVDACSNLDLTQVPNTGCKNFYRCIGTNLYQFSCGVGFSFDPSTKLCSSTYQCPEIATTTTTATTTVSTTTTAPPSNSILNTNVQCTSSLNLTPIGPDCSRYYMCSSSTNTLWVMICPTGFIFDSTLKNCLPTSVVVCTAGSAGSPTTTSTPTLSACESAALTIVPGTNCAQYYICASGTLLQVSCNPGSMFDTTLKSCNPFSPVCNEPTTTTTTTTTVATTTTTTTAPLPLISVGPVSCPSADLTPVVQTNCVSFYRCVGLNIYQFSCPTGQLFDRNTKLCSSAITTCS